MPLEALFKFLSIDRMTAYCSLLCNLNTQHWFTVFICDHTCWLQSIYFCYASVSCLLCFFHSRKLSSVVCACKWDLSRIFTFLKCPEIYLDNNCKDVICHTVFIKFCLIWKSTLHNLKHNLISDTQLSYVIKSDCCLTGIKVEVAYRIGQKVAKS